MDSAKKKPAKKNPVGAPTIYRPEICEQVMSYMKTAVMPTIAGIAVLLGHHRQTIYEWVDKHQEFGDTIKHIKDYQEDKLVEGAMTHKLNSTFCIFFAKNNLGYRDVQEIKEVDQDTEDIQELQNKIRELNKKLGM